MSKIVKILGRQVLDSRGFPTVQCEAWTEFGGYGIAKVPSGASTGEREALEMRDGGKEWNGKGVMNAVNNINKKIAPVVVGMEVTDQLSVDQAMLDLDGTPLKKNLGANAILGVSLAVAKAAADELQLPLYEYLGGPSAHVLPVPMMNVINGGAHADSAVDFQEFMIMPVGAPNFREAIRWSSETFHALKALLKSKGDITAVGDEGGFAPDFKWAYPQETTAAFKAKMPVDVAFETLEQAIKNAGYKLGPDGFMFAMDCASSELYNQSPLKGYKEDNKYHFKKLEKITGEEFSMTAQELNDYLVGLTKKYPIISIEDGFDENDWEGFAKFESEIGDHIQNVGDDLYTNKRVNIPGVDINEVIPFLEKRDADDIKFGCEQKMDCIAASFTNKPENIKEIKEILKKNGREDIQVYSKIESVLGIQNFDAILAVEEGVMIARGDLGLEIPYFDVPYYEQQIINKCRAAGKPVIVATQMLDTMTESPQPTRAEVTDVFAAVQWGADATMTSGETSNRSRILEYKSELKCSDFYF